MTSNFLSSERGNSKSSTIKKRIIRRLVAERCTIADLSHTFDLSVPTVTKFIGELIDEEFIIDLGKHDTSGGRRPNIYGINPNAGYFIGVDVRHDRIELMAKNFNAVTISSEVIPNFQLKNSPEIIDRICCAINNFMGELKLPEEKILSIGINLPGRINAASGYSFTHLYFEELPLTEIISDRIGGYNVTIDNDTRAMAYGEFIYGATHDESNMLFVNVDWGIGLGIIINKKLYYGKSGYSGEMGHALIFGNEQMCGCGKKGCLETEVSGSAIIRKLKENYSAETATCMREQLETGDINLQDFINAIDKEDILAIELIEKLGDKLGKYMAGMINIFNPELVVIGGMLSRTGDYLLLPLVSAIKRNSLNLVNNDTDVRLAKLGDSAGVIGACMLTRNRLLEIL